jgi:hypothetical protein
MAKSLSEDLREGLLTAIEAGASRRAAAERFGVSAIQRQPKIPNYGAPKGGPDLRALSPNWGFVS